MSYIANTALTSPHPNSNGYLFDITSFGANPQFNVLSLEGSAAVTVSANKLSVTGVAFNLANIINYPVNVSMEKWEMGATIEAVTVASAGAVQPIGLRPNSVRNTVLHGVAMNIDLGNSATRGTINILTCANPTGGFTTRASSTAMTVNNGDIVTLKLTRDGNLFTAEAVNATTATTRTCTYTYSISSTANPILPNSCRPAIFTYLTSTILFSRFYFRSLMPTNIKLLCMGDSKMAGYNSGTYALRFAGRLQSAYPNQVAIISGYGDETADSIRYVDYIRIVKPKNVLYEFGSNDTRNGYPNESSFANFVMIRNACNDVNANLFVVQFAETAGNLQAPLMNRFKLVVDNSKFILSYPSLAADGVHLADDAAQLTAFNDINAVIGPYMT